MAAPSPAPSHRLRGGAATRHRPRGLLFAATVAVPRTGGPERHRIGLGPGLGPCRAHHRSALGRAPMIHVHLVAALTGRVARSPGPSSSHVEVKPPPAVETEATLGLARGLSRLLVRSPLPGMLGSIRSLRLLHLVEGVISPSLAPAVHQDAEMLRGVEAFRGHRLAGDKSLALATPWLDASHIRMVLRAASMNVGDCFVTLRHSLGVYTGARRMEQVNGTNLAIVYF